jgi:hypothetical protein
LGGSSLFVVIALIFGISDLTFKKEIILLGSLGVIIYLMIKILGTLSSAKRHEIIGIAVIVFVFRAMPTYGAGPAGGKLMSSNSMKHFLERCARFLRFWPSWACLG